jgi:hypothetical protein
VQDLHDSGSDDERMTGDDDEDPKKILISL